MMPTIQRRRPGFTLIELLTIIAIIAILMALSVGAYFRVRVSQEEGATVTTLQKLQNQLGSQWRTVLDNCKDDARKGQLLKWAVAAAGDDPIRAHVIHTKMKLKQEFPQNFYEALVWPAQMRNQGIPIESIYAKDLVGITPQDPATLPVDRQMQESAVLLYLSLTKVRRGNAAFNPTEHIGPHALGKITLDGIDFSVFKDSWGQPIAFIRWPVGGAGSDLNQPPNNQLNSLGQPVDPQDPEKTLVSPSYNGSALQTAFINTLGHPLSVPPLNLSPVVLSAGRDKRWGINAQLPAPTGPDHFRRISTDEDDNVYGYRGKTVGRPQ